MTALLVANRGEIAVRVFRTARRLGMRCIAVYSDADADALFVEQADAAVHIGSSEATASYLNIDAIIDAATRSGATMIHPGYGFLSEDPLFAEACEKHGIVFVGPPSEVLRLMGAKDIAKQMARDAGVPVLEGYAEGDQSDEAFAAAAAQIGYPIMVKPIAGGGGKGMSVAHTEYQLIAALGQARRAGMAAFADDRLLIERCLLHPRHIEVQVMADGQGSVIHLGERDCSLQRRHQKILEESPAPGLDASIRDLVCRSAVDLARSVGYRSAGTCEFLVGEDGAVAFLEMNARLQVEHPVTEMVTGFDLVEMQLQIAQGSRLELKQENVVSRGSAIEVRIYAEDPDHGFLPQSGTIAHMKIDEAEGVRIDTGVR
ncbi:MAG: ATP-grasp domain-containing protein, partial [Actinobacteria bacterium]|nr:ATP-grasp domain-containing protein [Actinomycetota bacterium]